MNNLLAEIQEIVGRSGILLGDEVAERSDSWPPTGGCQAKAIIRPASTDEVSKVLKLIMMSSHDSPLY